MGAKAIKLGSWDNILHTARIGMSCVAYAQWPVTHKIGLLYALINSIIPLFVLFISAFSNYQVLSHQEVFFPRKGRK